MSGNEFKRASAAEPLPISRSSVGGDLAIALELVHHNPLAVSVEPGLEDDDPSDAKNGFARRSPLLISLLDSFEVAKGRVLLLEEQPQSATRDDGSLGSRPPRRSAG